MTAAIIKPDLLFVTPFPPQESGLGIAMRAGAHVAALAERFRVTVAIVAPGRPGGRDSVPPAIAERCAEILATDAVAPYDRQLEHAPRSTANELRKAVYPRPLVPARHRTGLAEIARRLAGRRFDALFCFRLHVAGVVELLAAHGIEAQRKLLDLDDYESRAHARSARNLVSHMGRMVALTTLVEAAKLRRYEQRMVARFDAVTVASDLDRAVLAQRFPRARFATIPNIIRPPAPLARKADGPFTFLYLGTMGYHPNADAADYFCRDILPLLRRNAPGPLRILIAGREAQAIVGYLANPPEIEVMSDVADVADCYRQADAVIVPLRTGSGTRIKIIEAFAYDVPVISTPIGAEGLDVEDGQHLLLAADAESFANRCRDLMADAELRRRLAAAGHRLWSDRYTPAAVAQQLGALLGRSARIA